MTDLHLVSWNRPKMTELVIKTIHRNTIPGTFRLTVLDNGSDQETQQMLINMEKAGLIHSLVIMDQNLGLERARQLLLTDYATEKYFVCVDNDCLPPIDWLPNMLNLMDYYEEYSAISQRTQVMIGTGNIFEEADKDNRQLVDFAHPGGSFRIMDTAVVKHTGGWDRGAAGRGSEERYICGKLRDERYKTAFAAKIQCLHLFGTRDENETDRWGYDKDLKPEDTGHSDIWHPALANGDDRNEIEKYSGKELTDAYFNNKED